MTVLIDKAQSIIKGNAGTINKIGTIYNIANFAYKAITGKSLIKSDGYRPSQWGKAKNSKNMVEIASNIGGFFADAVLNFSVDMSNTITSHPVQNGANISDHVIENPFRLNVELGISDAMGYYTKNGYTIESLEEDLAAQIKKDRSKSLSSFKKSKYGINAGWSKSSNALALLRYMAQANVPFTVRGVRPILYDDMLIESMSWTEDASSVYSLRVNLSLVTVRLVDVAQEKVSARNWTSGAGANKGEAQGVEQGSTMYKMGL